MVNNRNEDAELECKRQRRRTPSPADQPSAIPTLTRGSPPPPPPQQSPQCTDLIVLGINYKSSEETVRSYFEQFGPLSLCEIKRDYNGVSKGFGFIRFKDYKSQTKVLRETHHVVDGRACQVKIPESKHGPNTLTKAAHTMRKIFVARLPQGTTTEDLRAYFSQFGEVVDVYIGQPFRAFGFVTFRDTTCIPLLYSQQHFLNGASLHIGPAEPKGSTGAGGMGIPAITDHRQPSCSQHLITAIQHTSAAAAVNQQQQQQWNPSQTMGTFLAHAIQQKMNQPPQRNSTITTTTPSYSPDIAAATAAAFAAAAATQQTPGSADISQQLMQMLQQPNVMAGFLNMASGAARVDGWEAAAAAAAALAAATASSITANQQNNASNNRAPQYYDPSATGTQPNAPGKHDNRW